VADGFGARLSRAVEGLTPGYFALVMATGIISVGTHLEGQRLVSNVLLVLCAAAFVVLLGLTVARFVAYRHAVVSDFMDPRRAFGFFTFVAGTNVLGVRLGLAGHNGVTAGLLVASGLAWLVLGYVVPWTAVLGREERPVVATANGTWFIWVVASQSVAVAAATIEPVYDQVRRELAVLAVMSWSVGVALYCATGLIVALRLMLYEFGPEELTPPYWVSMGALAITVLAGARIVQMADAPMVAVTRDLVAGLVAPRPPSSAPQLRGDAVEHGLSPRHVRRRRDLPGPCRPPADRGRSRTGGALGGSRNMDNGLRGDVQARLPDRARPGPARAGPRSRSTRTLTARATRTRR
jgi:tellurite resistance protein TehA-like permease